MIFFKKDSFCYDQLTVSLLQYTGVVPPWATGRIACMGSGLLQTVDATIQNSASRARGLLGRAVVLFKPQKLLYLTAVCSVLTSVLKIKVNAFSVKKHIHNIKGHSDPPHM